jgi:hypothetical protein
LRYRRLIKLIGTSGRIGLSCCALSAAVQGNSHAGSPEEPGEQERSLESTSAADDFGRFLRNAGTSSAGSVEGSSEPEPIDFPGAIAVVVQSSDGGAIGLHAGVTSVQGSDGSYQTAYLAITETGILVPVLADGKIAPAVELYFAAGNCTGTPYVSGSRQAAGYAPLPGSVFRSPRSDGLYYLPRDGQLVSLPVRSHHSITGDGAMECRKESRDLRLFETRAVFPEDPDTVYAFDAPISLRPLTLDPPEARKLGRRGRGRGVPKEIMREIQDALAAELEASRVVECAAGCPEANVGDGACDVFCHNDRCAYDGGDCDGLSREELARRREGMCAQGCLFNDVGDRFCDPNCNVAECEYDGGDCAVRPN